MHSLLVQDASAVIFFVESKYKSSTISTVVEITYIEQHERNII